MLVKENQWLQDGILVKFSHEYHQTGDRVTISKKWTNYNPVTGDSYVTFTDKMSFVNNPNTGETALKQALAFLQ